ncbi:MAG: HEPN domain-containing protein [Alphaproteobacteria bacterium]
MLLDQKIIKTGYFWLALNPEQKIFGRLEIDKTANITLYLSDIFDETDKFSLNNSKTFRINGYCDNYKELTLENCWVSHYSSNLNENKIRVGYAILGYAFLYDQAISINQLTFQLKDGRTWYPDRHHIHEKIKDTRHFIIPKPISNTITIPNGFELIIVKGSTWREHNDKSLIEDNIVFEINSNKLLTYKDFYSTLYNIKTLIDLFLGKPSQIIKMTAKNKNICIKHEHFGFFTTEENPILEIYHSTVLSCGNTSFSENKMLFKFSDIKDDLETIIQNWFSLIENAPSLIRSNFSIDYNGYKFIEDKLVETIHALEAYHRYKYEPNYTNKEKGKISLQDRLEEVIHELKLTTNILNSYEAIIPECKNIRNSIAHANIDLLINKNINGNQYYYLFRKMQTILKMCLLFELGFTLDEIKNKNFELGLNFETKGWG